MKRRMRWLGALMLLLIPFVLVRAQTGGSISGQVNDAAGGVLEGATVMITNVATGVEHRTSTDASGRYHHDDLAIGIYRIRVQKVGFSEANRNVSISDLGERLQASFELQPGGITESVTVTASRGERDVLEIPVRAEAITPELLQRINPTTPGDALLNLPNVTAVNNGPFQIRPRLRGLDSSRVLVMLDGERLNTSRVATDRAGVEIGLVDPSLIENIEVVYGSGSVLYGTDALSGTINIITDTPRLVDSAFRIGGGFNGYFSSNEPGRRGTGRIDLAGRKFAVRSSLELERYSNYHSGEPFAESNVGLIESGEIHHNMFGPISDSFNAPYTRTTSEVPNSQAHGSDDSITGRWFPTENQNLRISLNRRRAA
ncbi:MAG: TonB-dependent receptor, partial [Acidobacteria bacterium]|nr:TonB-dependent receptor [Acidobacteriota bacterium]